jgi:hypothetical protein
VVHAVQQHLDPGPGLRERADRLARRWSGGGWYRFAFPLIAVPLLFDGRWERPATAIPGALMVVGTFATGTLWWHRMTTRARRWVADPPGPRRDVEPAGTWEQLLSSRRVAWTVVGMLILGLVLLLVGELLDGA